MNFKLFLYSCFICLSLNATSRDRVASHIHDVIPQEESLENGVHNAQQVLADPNSTEEQIIYAKLKLIVYCYVQEDFGRVRTLCREIIVLDQHHHEHAKYFLGELYFYGYNVQQNYQTALQYYQELMDQEHITNILLPGPSTYKCFAARRIAQIGGIIDGGAVPAS